MIRRIVDWLLNSRIYKKLVIFICICMLSMFAVQTVLLLLLSSSNARKQIDMSMLSYVNQYNASVVNIQDSMISLVDYYGVLPATMQMYRDARQNLTPLIPIVMTRSAIVQKDFAALAFFDREGMPLDFFVTDNSISLVEQTDASRPLQTMLENNTVYKWEFIKAGEKKLFAQQNSDMICLWHIIRNYNTMQPMGAVCAATTTKRLSVTPLPDTDDSFTDILDDHGKSVLGRIAKMGEDARLQIIRQTPVDQQSGILHLSLNGQNWSVAFSRIQESHFVIYHLSPWQFLNLGFGSYVIYIAVTMVLFAAMIFLLILFLSRIITRPILHLKQEMLDFSSGDEGAKAAIYYDDEIGTLCRVFNEMVLHHRELIERTYLLQIKEKEAELRSLQTQINPHFLYNLISAIQWKALRKDDAEIAEIAYSMGQVFRISLNRGQHTLSLRQEKQLIEYYLKLQKMRYSSRLTYEVFFDEKVLELSIPKLLIQPLVENSVVHGAENSQTVVHVQVDVRLSEDESEMIIVVSDNGIGIPEDVMALLPDRLPVNENTSSSRYALKNIAERLKLSYKKYTFDISSEYQKYTTITITFPVCEIKDMMTMEEAST